MKDRLSDRALGIRTTRKEDLEASDVDSENLRHAHRYEPTPYGVLEEMLMGLDIDHRRFDFVDLGSGKGRILCVAATYPFGRVIGVELSRALHRIALEDLRQRNARARRCREVIAVLGDAVAYELQTGPSVIFLFNPFEPPVLGRVLDNLERVHAIAPVERYVLYYMPLYRELLDGCEVLGPYSSDRDWVIYRTL